MTTLFTPVRKALLKVRPAAVLGKRVRGEEFEFSDLDPVVDTPRSSTEPSFSFSLSPVTADSSAMRIALQNEDSDPSFADTVVITTLNNIPFCCHEDLLTMSRFQLLEVIRKLNEKLPEAMKVLVHCQMTKRDLRREIEVVVGIRESVAKEVPNAPKMDRKHARERPFAFRMIEVDEDEDTDNSFSSPPTSPLARRSRRGTPAPPLTPRLTRLVEEDEEQELSPMSIDRHRPYKRRRVSSEMSIEFSPTPLARTTFACERPSPMLKTSTFLEDGGEMDLDLRCINVSRPRYQTGKENNRRSGRRESSASEMDLSG